MVCFSGEASWRDAREKKSAEIAQLLERRREKEGICTITQLSSHLKMILTRQLWSNIDESTNE